ncbi:hypothetical protein KHC28_14365 [Ancylobacter sonchi]|uniref:hypothetical protein n=1 Tax=Ancylobacter sonchi TaxID=1937790 RepID=UPI001BD3DC5F|nr:hypothetical protein [Ancylobacter sonchi]MBS7534842.1 hypothetical protein [Ancylobacter sonchi]
MSGQDAPSRDKIWQVMECQCFHETDCEDYLPPSFRQYETIDTAKAVDEIVRLTRHLHHTEEMNDQFRQRAQDGAMALAQFLYQNLPAEFHGAAAGLLLDLDHDGGVALLLLPETTPAAAPTITLADEDDDVPANLFTGAPQSVFNQSATCR